MIKHFKSLNNFDTIIKMLAETKIQCNQFLIKIVCIVCFHCTYYLHSLNNFLFMYLQIKIFLI